MRPRTARTLVGGGAALTVAVVAGLALAPDLRADSSGVSPNVLKRIAQKNDRAAMEAAAQMRERSRLAAAAADSRLAAEERGRAQAERMLARAGPVAKNAPAAN
jgi:hypothetical protein